MSASGSQSAKGSKRGKPAHTCAICKRRYQPLRTPGMRTIYSICPDCRQHAAPAGR